MANVYAGATVSKIEKTRSRSANIAAAATIFGDASTWVVSSAAGGAFDLTVGDYDSSMTNDYIDVNNPLLVIKCVADTSVNNVTVKNSDGDTLATFAADYSGASAAKYVCLRLVASKRTWELA